MPSGGVYRAITICRLLYNIKEQFCFRGLPSSFSSVKTVQVLEQTINQIQKTHRKIRCSKTDRKTRYGMALRHLSYAALPQWYWAGFENQ